jgi:hypothetical protein
MTKQVIKFIRVLTLGRNSDVTKIIQKNNVIYFASQGEGLISFNATTEEFKTHSDEQSNAPSTFRHWKYIMTQFISGVPKVSIFLIPTA